ncbi:MAG TPA: response regulator [Longimicrobium sp.]|nr:response regulator [Longimicrobium sp.]
MTDPAAQPLTILMADDDPDDRLLARLALERQGMHGVLRTVNDGEELLDYLHRRGAYTDAATSPRPHLVLLDLNMPRMDGREALHQLKSDPALRQIPVVVLTTSRSEEEVFRSYDLGANSFVTKPVTFDELVAVLQRLELYWLRTVSLPPAPPRA